MQAIVAERTRVMGPCTNLHPGDIAHRIYSGLRDGDPGGLVPVWRDARGIAAFGIIWRADHSFDFVSRIDLDGRVVAATVAQIADLASVNGEVATDVIGDDRAFTGILRQLGFAARRREYVFSRVKLQTPIDAPSAGFDIRSARFSDTRELAAVHRGAFGGDWSPAGYGRRMRMPGYDPGDEIVAVDADGTFMGFAVTWYDALNAVGYFEPLGVHRDYHRRGVGSALLSEGKRRMLDRAMTTATVWHTRHDPGATEFYRLNGFDAVNTITRWDRISSGDG